MEKNKTEFSGYQKLAATVITNAAQDILSNTEMEIISLEAYNLNTKTDLTEIEKKRKKALSKIIRENDQARYFFENRDYILWADTIDMDHEVLYNKYLGLINK